MGKKEKKSKTAEQKAQKAAKQNKKATQKVKKAKSKNDENEDVDLQAVLDEYSKQVSVLYNNYCSLSFPQWNLDYFSEPVLRSFMRSVSKTARMTQGKNSLRTLNFLLQV